MRGMNLSLPINWHQIAAAVLLCSGAMHVQAKPVAAAQTPLKAVLEPCQLAGIETQVTCGKVTRPLDASKPQGKQLDVHFAVLPAIARNKLPDPVILFAGGPGQSGLKLAPMAQGLLGRLRNRRDVIVFDQRGVGKSMDLSCPASPRESTASTDMQQIAQRILKCKTELKAKHGLVEESLIHFTTVDSSRDVDAIRQAVGAQQLNLVGASYGTRAALDYMRQYPQQVRRVVIDGLAPPDMVLPRSFEVDIQAAWDGVVKACEADKTCNARYPNLKAALDKAIAALPQPVELRHGVTLQRERVVFTRDMLLTALRPPLYAPHLAQALPFAVTQASQGDYGPLASLAGGMASPGTELAWGMHFSVICAEDFPRVVQAGPLPTNQFTGIVGKLYAEVCQQWPQAPVPAAFYEMPPAKVATLLLSGGADPATPPRHGERVAKALGANARHVVAPQLGHGVMAAGCGRDVVFQFINASDEAKALEVDAKCLERIPRPLAFTAPLPLPPASASQGATAAKVLP